MEKLILLLLCLQSYVAQHEPVSSKETSKTVIVEIFLKRNPDAIDKDLVFFISSGLAPIFMATLITIRLSGAASF